MIFDNADDSETELSNYFPTGVHGSILITTRNPSLRHLSPGAHLELGNMDEDEAVEIILFATFPPGENITYASVVEKDTMIPKPTARDREAAIAIVNQLECLPIAVVQAACYIQQHKVLHQYLDQLKANRSYLLQSPTQVHLDRLKYPHSVYASFDIALHALAPRALKLLGVLSFFHFSNFPRPLFAIAAESKFTHEYLELADRPPEFHESIRFLNDILCPHNEWREVELYALLEDLQKYSLVTMVPIHNMITLRFHPLVHNWAQDRLSVEERAIYRAAAVRLFICGVTKEDDHGILEYLQPHVTSISAACSDRHVNDQAAIAIFSRHYEGDAYLAVWTRIHAVVVAKYGTQDLRSSRALLQLAEAHMRDREKMQAMKRSVIETREAILGGNHPETAAARASLVRGGLEYGLLTSSLMNETEAVQKDVLRVYIHSWGLFHRDTAQGMLDLAKTYERMDREKRTWNLVSGQPSRPPSRVGRDAECLLSGAVMILTKVAGRTAQSTIRAINQLAEYHYKQRKYTKAETLRKQVLVLNRDKHGEQHVDTVESMQWLALQYLKGGRYLEAEKLTRVEVETRRQIQGNQHHATQSAIGSLAKVYERLERYEEAEKLWKEKLADRQATNGDTDSQHLNAICSLAQLYEKQGRYAEAEEMWKEELAAHRAAKGDMLYLTRGSIRSLSKLYEKQGRDEEAERLWKEELAGRRATLGDTDYHTLDAISSLDRLYKKLGWYEC
jgi:tetratricopeptide (TPR) repeat protein